MAKKARVTRKQLLKEPDEFITFTGKMIQWSRTYRKQLVYGVVAVVLVAVGIGAFQQIRYHSDRRAFTRIDEVVSAYEQLKADKNADAAFQESVAGFDQVMQQADGRPAGVVAAARFAKIAYEAKAYQKAAQLYQLAIDQVPGQPLLQDGFLSSLGHCYLKLDQKDQAAAAFEQMTQLPQKVRVDEALFLGGVLRTEAGDAKGGNQLLEKLISEQPGSLYYPVAQEKLAG